MGELQVMELILQFGYPVSCTAVLFVNQQHILLVQSTVNNRPPASCNRRRLDVQGTPRLCPSPCRQPRRTVAGPLPAHPDLTALRTAQHGKECFVSHVRPPFRGPSGPSSSGTYDVDGPT